MLSMLSRGIPMINRRAVLLAAVCAIAAPMLPGSAFAEETFDLVTFFRGRTVGVGSFSAPIAGIKRDLTVKTRGKWDGKTLTLVEDFFYADGERGRKTWRFKRIAPGRYEGRREDVVGVADVRQVGRLVTLSYLADIRAKDGTVTRLGFNDTIGYSSSGGVYNTASVTRFGLPIGNVTITFEKQK
jgi:hypothetical protein